MWLSKQIKPETPTADADLGVTTITGQGTGVVTRGEIRDLPVYGPGGYMWMPENGAQQCGAGVLPAQPPEHMQPGEISLQGPGGGTVYLRSDGTVELQTEQTLKLKGETVSVEGLLIINGEPYKPCEC